MSAPLLGRMPIAAETGPDSLRKIPGVCRALKVPSINLVELFDAEDWVIG